MELRFLDTLENFNTLFFSEVSDSQKNGVENTVVSLIPTVPTYTHSLTHCQHSPTEWYN